MDFNFTAEEEAFRAEVAQFAKRPMMIDHPLGDLGHHPERYIEFGKASQQ